MKKILYTRPDGGISIVIPAPIEHLRRTRPKMTVEEYEARVRERSIPADAINVRDISDADLPSSREFRDAWCDITPESKIDIDCTKAKEIAIAQLRERRNAKLEATDKLYMQALEANDTTKLNELKTVRQQLRDATEPLKALDTLGKVNDETLLTQIRQLRDVD